MEPRTKPFVICEVEFEDRIARSISCSSWIIKLDHLADEKPQTYCLLPKDKGTDSSLLAKYDTIPGKDWTPFKCKILGECNEYEDARLQLIRLNESLGYSGGTKANASKANASKANVPKANVSRANVSRANVSRANVSKDTDGARCLEPEKQYQSSDLSSYVTEYLLHEERKLKARQQAKNLVDNIMKINRLSLKRIDESDHKRDYYNFPLKTLKDVAEMEGKLRLTSLNHLIIKSHLWKFGPLSNVNDTVPYMLQRLISDDCAKNYDYDGINSTKRHIFKNLIMCSIVVDVAMSYHSDSSMDVIEHQIRNWLTVATMRCKNMELLRKKKPRK